MLSPTGLIAVLERGRFCAIMSRRVHPVLARYELLRGKAMSKKLNGMLILCVSALWLSGCAYFRASGPCFGVGCPSHTAGGNGQYKPGQAPKAQTANAKSSPSTKATVTSAQAARQPAVTNAQHSSDGAAVAAPPAQAKAPDAKPSIGARFSDFFAHLLPHHNKTAKPAASAD
jgi:hypothetical protein